MTNTNDNQKMWIGHAPTECDLCRKRIRNAFVDGMTYQGAIRGLPGGRWAIMCLPCHGKHGVGLGTGVGQQYEQQAVVEEKGAVKWVKVRG